MLIPQPKLIIPQLEVTKAISVVHPVSKKRIETDITSIETAV